MNPAALVAGVGKAWAFEYAPGKTKGKPRSAEVSDVGTIGIGRLEDELPVPLATRLRVRRIEDAGIERGVVIGHVVAVEVVGNAVRTGPALPCDHVDEIIGEPRSRQTGSRGWSGRPAC